MDEQARIVWLVPQGGRYPYGLARYATGNIRAMLTLAGDELRLRIEDLEQIDRWEEFVVPRKHLVTLLQRVEEAA